MDSITATGSDEVFHQLVYVEIRLAERFCMHARNFRQCGEMDQAEHCFWKAMGIFDRLDQELDMWRRLVKMSNDNGNKKSNEHKLHCPICFQIGPHTRRVCNGMELFTCKKCGYVQEYVMSSQVAEEEE